MPYDDFFLLKMCALGFRRRRSIILFFVSIPTRFSERKLAQEGNPFARKRNSMNFLVASQ